MQETGQQITTSDGRHARTNICSVRGGHYRQPNVPQLEVAMSTTDHLPRPSVRRRIEQTLAAHPGGVPAEALREVLDERARTLGDGPVGTHQLIRQLGLLLIEGRIDERDGVWTLRVDHAHAGRRHTRDQAA
jgi:hypothetical protein